jgi:hypothetical protein
VFTARSRCRKLLRHSDLAILNLPESGRIESTVRGDPVRDPTCDARSTPV